MLYILLTNNLNNKRSCRTSKAKSTRNWMKRVKHLSDLSVYPLEEDLPLDLCRICRLNQKHCTCHFGPQSGTELDPCDKMYLSNQDYLYRSKILRGHLNHLQASLMRRINVIAYELDQLDHLHASVLDTASTRCTDGSDHYFGPQSGPESTFNVMKVDTDTQYQNVRFLDQHDPYMCEVDSATDPTRTVNDTDDASLQNFFSRPLKINSTTWSVGTAPKVTLNPWALYFNNPRVANRISNYKLLRCRLHVKIVVNGNGFYYGRMMAAYDPLIALSDTGSLFDISGNGVKIIASQRPKVFIDPTMSRGGELILPFFYHKNNLSVPDKEFENLGNLTYITLNVLKHANGGTDNVTVTTFAWAEDVQLNVLTTREPGTLSPQSGKEDENDEANNKGFISGPASTVAKAAGVLSKIPEIAPFALATQAGAMMVANIAKRAGYCKPNLTKASDPYRPTPTANLALTDTPDTCHKLSVEAKQETTLDPRVAGIGPVDTLSIKSIAQRESYVATFGWQVGTAPETLLWNTRVQPTYFDTGGGAAAGAILLTAITAASIPFKYWTGSIKYRFQIVASAFHKGRLKIVYDPDFIATNEYNTNYMQIIDIADRTDFTVTIGNGQEKTPLTKFSLLDSPTEFRSATPYASKEVGNGVLGIYVVNDLTTPTPTIENDININVYVSAGDDFEVFAPDSTEIQRCVFSPQSGEEHPDKMNTMEPDAPEQTMSTPLGPTDTDDPNRNKVYFGEVISSFRPLLKRYNAHSMIGDETTGGQILAARRCFFPFYRGNVPNAVHTTAALASYNYCNTVLLHWVTQCFAGFRGAIRWKFMPSHTNGNVFPKVTRRTPGSDTLYQDTTVVEPTATSYSTAAHHMLDVDAYPHGHDGMAVTLPSVNDVLEWENPFYSEYRFIPGRRLDLTSARGDMEMFDLSLHYRAKTNGDYHVIMCAAGEDFQPLFWLGMSPVWIELLPPAA